MIRVFPRRTKWTPIDDLAFIGDPPLFRPPIQPVAISVTFTWDIPEGERLAKAWSAYYPDTKIGGPAYGDPGAQFVPGRFLKHGVTITSRGCPNHCPWCVVPQREGQIRELDIIHDGYIVQDNNLLACSGPHLEAVFDMLRLQKRGIIFSGGLDARLLLQWHRDLLDSIRVKELWFACDQFSSLASLEHAALILDGIPISKRRCYVMIGYNGETVTQAAFRLRRVYELGFLPFCQLYRGPMEPEYTQEWKDLRRKWSRPAAYRDKRMCRRRGFESAPGEAE